jgi:hypothetical protein
MRTLPFMSPQETLTSYAAGPVLRAPVAALRKRWEPRAPPCALLAPRLSCALSRLLPTLLGCDLNTLDTVEHPPAPAPHDGDCDWAMVLSLPGAASPLPSRPATPAQGYAWGVEGMPGGLRAGKHRLQFAEADALALGALDIALDARPTDGKIRVRILPAGDTSASADLAADPDPILDAGARSQQAAPAEPAPEN